MDEKQAAMHKIVAAIHQAGLQDVVSAGFEPWKSRVKIYFWCNVGGSHTAGVANFFGPSACDPARARADIQALPARCNTDCAMRASVVGRM
jgi:hypothetical protein